jgi:hypothetical protein
VVGLRGYRYSVLATVSAVALMVSVERGAIAADFTPTCQDDRWWLSAEGQYLFYDGDPAKYGIDNDEDGDNDFAMKLKPDDGWGVGGEIGFQPACSPWSFLGRVRYGQSNKEKDHDTQYSTFDGGFTSGSAEADHREKHWIVDLEIGRDVGLGALSEDSNVRVFAGLRFAHFKGKGSMTTNYYSHFGYSNYTIERRSNADFKRKFTGIGPRIGFDAMLPFDEHFSLDLGAAGALLFGKQKFEVDGTNYSNFESNDDIREKRSKTVVVPNLEASAAFSWLVTDNAQISLGYRIDSYWDVYDTGDIVGGRDEGDRIIHGPFLKFTIGIGGDGG